jgi:hypothetical protein
LLYIITTPNSYLLPFFNGNSENEEKKGCAKAEFLLVIHGMLTETYTCPLVRKTGFSKIPRWLLYLKILLYRERSTLSSRYFTCKEERWGC